MSKGFSEYKPDNTWVEGLKEIAAGVFLAAILIGMIIFSFSVLP
jgi:hypothetical protein